MNLKALILTLALATTGFISNAQNQDSTSYDEENCKKYRSLYYQYLKQGMYRDACTFWAKAYGFCGDGDSVNTSFFTNGKIAFSRLAKKTEDEARKNEINDTIVWIYERRLEKEQDPDWALDLAVFMAANKYEDVERFDELFKNIHVLKEKCSPAQMQYYFIHLLTNKFNAAPQEKKDEMRDMIIEEYLKLSQYVSDAIKATEDEKKISGYKNAQDFLDKYFVKIAKDCEALTPVFDKKFETLPENKEEALPIIEKYVKLMERQNCTKTKTYAKYVQKMVDLNPTASGLSGLGNVQMARENYNEAVTSFEKAVEMEADGENKNSYLFQLAQAQLKAHKYSAAFRTAKQVDGDYQGKAMLIAASAIASTANGCGESTFARKANYWLANDYVRKASSLGEEVSSGKYLSNAPTQQEGFSEGVAEGSSYSLKCWGESTTVRY